MKESRPAPFHNPAQSTVFLFAGGKPLSTLPPCVVSPLVEWDLCLSNGYPLLLLQNGPLWVAGPDSTTVQVKKKKHILLDQQSGWLWPIGVFKPFLELPEDYCFETQDSVKTISYILKLRMGLLQKTIPKKRPPKTVILSTFLNAHLHSCARYLCVKCQIDRLRTPRNAEWCWMPMDDGWYFEWCSRNDELRMMNGWWMMNDEWMSTKNGDPLFGPQLLSPWISPVRNSLVQWTSPIRTSTFGGETWTQI